MAKKEYDVRLGSWILKAYGSIARLLLEDMMKNENKCVQEDECFKVGVSIDNDRSSLKGLRILQERGIIRWYTSETHYDSYGYTYRSTKRIIYKAEVWIDKFNRLGKRLASKPDDSVFLQKSLSEAANLDDLYIEPSSLGKREALYVWFHKDEYSFKEVTRTHRVRNTSRCYGGFSIKEYKIWGLLPKSKLKVYDQSIFMEKYDKYFKEEGLWILNNILGVPATWGKLKDVETLTESRLKGRIEEQKEYLRITTNRLKESQRALKALIDHGGYDTVMSKAKELRLEALIRQAPIHAGQEEEDDSLRELSKLTLLGKHKEAA